MANYSRDPPPPYSPIPQRSAPHYPNYGRSQEAQSRPGRSSVCTHNAPNYAAVTPDERSHLILVVPAGTHKRESRTSNLPVVLFFLFATIMGIALIIAILTIQAENGIDGGRRDPRWPGEWDRERRQRQRWEWEQERREEQERRRMNLWWDKPIAGLQCFAHGSREYTARLWNIPIGYNWTKACENTKVEINGMSISKPDFCEDRGIWGGVYGHWIVHTGEIACLPHWGSFSDQGCVAEGSHLHRVHSRLWNIGGSNDWMRMCSTAPATFHNRHFARPTYCENKGFWGIYGIWEYEDFSC
ncbi:hypothetical protein BD779DRAFT_1492357 [Infundibulicybe gibba]|nr:hypothetical protein BD779DRAFT_1492357 [Infundibulicybe gibba]